jgi:beta-catenin-like protein 1
LPLTQNPGLFYPEIVKSGAAALLASLLSHENTDIAIGVVEIIQELTDEDVGAGEDEIDEEDPEDAAKAAKTRMALAEFIDDLVSNSGDAQRADMQLNNSILDLLVANLGRLNESEDTDSTGVHNILGVFENLLSFMPPLADQIVAETTLLPWLLKRVDTKGFDSNKQYASQILAIILQQSRENVLKLLELDGMQVMLKALSVRQLSLSAGSS